VVEVLRAYATHAQQHPLVVATVLEQQLQKEK
jgi:hypothetical protein